MGCLVKNEKHKVLPYSFNFVGWAMPTSYANADSSDENNRSV
jgi:hypothetical protein